MACTRWRCLTAAEKFGIIFSATVVAITFAIVWMCCLGKSASAHRRRQTVSLPGGRRALRDPRMPPGTAMGQLPIACHHPGCPPQVWYQPAMYGVDNPNDARRVYPYPQALMAGPYGHNIPTVFDTPRLLPAAQAHTQQADHPASWRNRLGRIFAPPMGRASTIASNDEPRRSTSMSSMRAAQASRRQSMDGTTTPRRRSVDTAAPATTPRKQGRRDDSTTMSPRHTGGIRVVTPVGSPRRDRAPVNSPTMSISSDAATVHSDDYDLVEAHPVQCRAHQPPETQSRQLENQNEDLMAVPTVSSMTTPTMSGGRGRKAGGIDSVSPLRRESARADWEQRMSTGSWESSEGDEGRIPAAPVPIR